MDCATSISVRALPPSYSGNPPAQYYDVPQKLADGRTKNPAWLARRPEQTGSQAAALVSMSPYKDDSPELVYGRLSGELPHTFEGNIHTFYGELYEPRIRAICSAAFGIRILETGLFRDRVRRHIGVSLDGETNALRLVGFSDAWPSRTERVEWTLGKCIWEAKASRMGLKSAPLIPHVMQVMLQMYVRHRHYAFLHYWHRDQTRVWLIRFSVELWRWMLRRLDLMHQHVARRVPVTAGNMYFPWLRSPSGRFFPGATTADYLMLAWFDVDPYPAKTVTAASMRASASKRERPSRPQISYAHWIDTLAAMRTCPGARPADEPRPGEPGHDGWLYWLSDVAGGSESAPLTYWDEDGTQQSNDTAQQPLPPKPEMWLVYNYARSVPASEMDLVEPANVAPHDPDDIEWFKREFLSVGDYARYMLSLPDYDTRAAYDVESQSYPPAPHLSAVGPGASRMRHLFVERFESVPELDEPDPVDQSNEDSAAERLDYQRRLSELEQRGAKRCVDALGSEHASKRTCDAPADEPMSPLIMHM